MEYIFKDKNGKNFTDKGRQEFPGCRSVRSTWKQKEFNFKCDLVSEFSHCHHRILKQNIIHTHTHTHTHIYTHRNMQGLMSLSWITKENKKQKSQEREKLPLW